jgi:hypothetical protein
MAWARLLGSANRICAYIFVEDNFEIKAYAFSLVVYSWCHGPNQALASSVVDAF